MVKAIYKITNLINGKVYIGQSVRPKVRFQEHWNNAKNKRDNYPIHNAMRKYGKENFQMEILEWTEEYDQREKDWINFYNSLFPNGYNLIEGGHSPIMLGENNPRNSITEDILERIIEDLKNDCSIVQIAQKYNVSTKVVGDINCGKSHKQKNLTYPIRNKVGLQKLTAEEADKIKSLLEFSDLSYGEIVKQFPVTKGNISQINNGRSFKDQWREYPIRKVPVKKNQFG